MIFGFQDCSFPLERLSDGKVKQWKYSEHSVHLNWLKYFLLRTLSTAVQRLVSFTSTPAVSPNWVRVSCPLLLIIHWPWISTSYISTLNNPDYSFKYFKFYLILISLTKGEYTLKPGHKMCYTISGKTVKQLHLLLQGLNTYRSWWRTPHKNLHTHTQTIRT